MTGSLWSDLLVGIATALADSPSTAQAMTTGPSQESRRTFEENFDFIVAEVA